MILQRRDLESVPAFRTVGKSVTRVDAYAKVTGRAQYASDIRLPRMLMGKILRSTRPHARIVSIGIDKAVNHAGVRAVVTSKDSMNSRYGAAVRDRFYFARDVVRYVGEPVAAVAAETESAAEEALSLIEVEYEDLQAVFDAEKAMEVNSPNLHPERAGYEGVVKLLPGDERVPNLSAHFVIRKGDVEVGFERADHIFENRYETQMVQHVEMERPACVAEMGTDGRINVWASSQAPYRILDELSQTFGFPHSRFRIFAPYSGGGFGNKLTMHVEAAAVALAMKTQRPVRVALSREEALTTTTVKHPFIMYIKDGVSDKGLLLARDIRIILNGGAYSGGSGVYVCRKCAFGAVATYNIPYLRVESLRVYTNQVPGGPFRGFGSEATVWAIETQMDEIANQLGLDRAAFRLKNLRQDGKPNILGEPMPKNGAVECFRKAVDDVKNAALPPIPNGWLRGVGYALGDKSTIAPTAACAEVKIHKDGVIEVRTSATEIGAGSQTVLSQIAAEELRTDVSKVFVTQPDTGYTPFDEGAFSSRQTYVSGNAVRHACIDAKRQVISKAAELLNEPETELIFEDGIIKSSVSSKQIKLSDLYLPLRWGSVVEGEGEFLGKAAWHEKVGVPDPTTGLAVVPDKKICSYYTPAAAAAVVDVDTETGKIRVVKLSCAVDAGKAINPMAVEGQIIGGLVMGLGSTIFEELISENGTILNTSFLEYQVLRAPDLPFGNSLSGIIVEVPEPAGPFGARGVGEASVTVVGAAITNAVSNATGKRIRNLPLTPENIWKA